MQSEEIIAAFDRAWNDRDVDGVIHLLTPNCTQFDAYFGDLVPAWNIAEYIKSDMDSAKVRYTITNIIECNADIAEYNYVAQIIGNRNQVIAAYDGVEVLRLNAGKVYRMTDFYVAPPELLSIYYRPDNDSISRIGHRSASDFGIENILQCRRKLIQGMRADFGFTDKHVTLTNFSRVIGYAEDLVLFVLSLAFHREFDEFVEKCRLDCARDMIRQQVLAGFDLTNLKVDKRIANKIGFKSHKLFVEAFTKSFCQTPREFRSILQEKRHAKSKAA